MLARQRKCSLTVIERRAVGIESVVAGQAIRAKGAVVHLHVGGIQVPVAAGAADRVNRCQALSVTVGAGKEGIVRCPLMALQPIARGLVWKGVGLEHRQLRIAAPVLGMAGIAGLGFDRTHRHAVQAGWIPQLGENAGVTQHTAVGHSLAAPERRVAS